MGAQPDENVETKEAGQDLPSSPAGRQPATAYEAGSAQGQGIKAELAGTGGVPHTEGGGADQGSKKGLKAGTTEGELIAAGATAEGSRGDVTEGGGAEVKKDAGETRRSESVRRMSAITSTTILPSAFRGDEAKERCVGLHLGGVTHQHSGQV